MFNKLSIIFLLSILTFSGYANAESCISAQSNPNYCLYFDPNETNDSPGSIRLSSKSTAEISQYYFKYNRNSRIFKNDAGYCLAYHIKEKTLFATNECKKHLFATETSIQFEFPTPIYPVSIQPTECLTVDDHDPTKAFISPCMDAPYITSSDRQRFTEKNRLAFNIASEKEKRDPQANSAQLHNPFKR